MGRVRWAKRDSVRHTIHETDNIWTNEKSSSCTALTHQARKHRTVSRDKGRRCSRDRRTNRGLTRERGARGGIRVDCCPDRPQATQSGSSQSLSASIRLGLIPQFFEFSRKLVEFDAPAALDRQFLEVRCWQKQSLHRS